jgi:pyrroline-5-carboxylate reductase
MVRLMTIELGILGSGNMAEAIARGVIRSGLLRPDQILAADVSPQRRELFSKELGVRAVDDNREVARQARTLLLSVKPQHMKEVLAGIGPVTSPDALVISIAAGVSSTFIETHLGGGKNWRVIRTMPNTPMLAGEGMVALARGRHATAQDAGAARKLFEAAADVIDVAEDKLDAVTAVSGSGPAYVFYLAEQMIRAGQELGLADEDSRKLAIKTCVGAAKMLATSADTPEELRRKVTSPGGTTQAAITHLDQNQVGRMIVEAIQAAARRSRELGS